MKTNHLQHFCFWKSDFWVTSNRKTSVFITALLLSGLNIMGQTTVFSEDFNRSTFGTSGGNPTMTWTKTGTAAISMAQVSGSNYQLTFDNGGTKSRSSISGPLTTFSTPFNSTLGSNKNDVIWTFNIRTARTSGSVGFAAGNGEYGFAVVLAATNSDFNLANGYAVTLRQGTAYNAIRLEKFANGFNPISRVTTIIGPSPDGTNNQNYFSVKVVYTPLSNTWKLFVRNDGGSAAVDPVDLTSGILTQVGTSVVDNTYTNTLMTQCGFFMSHGSTTTPTENKVNYDNFKVVVDNRTFTPSSSQFDWSTGSNWTQGSAPASNYDVELPYTAVVTNTSAASCKNLTLNNFSETQSTQFIKQAALTVSDKIRVKVKFTDANVWRFVGFPFAIAAVYKADGVTPAVLNTDYQMARYNVTNRANSQSGWEAFTTFPTTAGAGHIIASGADLVFETAQNPATDAFAASNDRALTYTTGTGAANHSGWNFVVSPVLANGTTTLASGEFRYAFNGTAYNVDDETDGTLTEYPFRAVFVKTGAAHNLTVSANNPFLAPRRNAATALDKLNLKLMAGTDEYVTKIRINNLSTAGYDPQYDAEQMFPFSSTVPQIYSTAGTTKLAINSVPQNTVIPVALRLSQTGTYKLTWEKQAVSAMLLYDTEESRYINLDNATEYEFSTTQSGTIANRFKIYTSTDVTTGINNLLANESIKLNVKGLTVQLAGLADNQHIAIFDIAGRKVYDGVLNATTVKLPCAGMYVLKITSAASKKELRIFAN